MEIPIFSLIISFGLGFIFLKKIKILKSLTGGERIVLSLSLGLSLCLFFILVFLEIQRLFAL